MRTLSNHPLSDLGFETSALGVHKRIGLYDLGFEPERSVGVKAAAAAQADVDEPALRPEIQKATNQPQPVGSTEAASGRVVTQPSDNPAVNQALATDAMRAYRADLKLAVQRIPGAKLQASRDAKNPERLAEKIRLEGQPAETVGDYGAAQISVDSPQAKDAVVAAVRKKFPIVRVKDRFAQGDPQYGYRSYSMQLQMSNGISQELQIVPREVFEANRAEHKDYKAARDAELAGEDADAARAKAKTLNDAAMQKFNSRNKVRQRPAQNGFVKGSAVRLPDGSRGIVSYLDPNMKIARVRTAGGKNITVRQNQLQAFPEPAANAG